MSNATSIVDVNRAIRAKFPKIRLKKGKGYFYIYSNDDDMALTIAGLYTTSIPVYAIEQQSTEQWVKDVQSLLNNEWAPAGW